MIYAVIRRRTGAWDFTKSLEEQPAWDEHADYMNQLEADGFALLVGPLGDQRKVLLIVRAQSAEEVEHRLASDPWTVMGLLETISIETWEIRLGSLD